MKWVKQALAIKWPRHQSELNYVKQSIKSHMLSQLPSLNDWNVHICACNITSRSTHIPINFNYFIRLQLFLKLNKSKFKVFILKISTSETMRFHSQYKRCMRVRKPFTFSRSGWFILINVLAVSRNAIRSESQAVRQHNVLNYERMYVDRYKFIGSSLCGKKVRTYYLSIKFKVGWKCTNVIHLRKKNMNWILARRFDDMNVAPEPINFIFSATLCTCQTKSNLRRIKSNQRWL